MVNLSNHAGRSRGLLALAGGVVFGLGVALAAPTQAATISLTSGLNGATYSVAAQAGTAGTRGVDYELGSWLAGGGGIGHGFKTSLSFAGGLCSAFDPSCFVSTPSAGTTPTGALEDTDNNWLQGGVAPIVVDLGLGNGSDKAIVFNSTDHLGVGTTYADPAKNLWNKVVEGIEFTVYGSNDMADAIAAAATGGVFGSIESGLVPGSGTGSSFEQGSLAFVFEDGWADFGGTVEGDDFASVWQFSQSYRYVAVYSNFTDPFVGDGFRSSENELDAIGRFIAPLPVPEPGTLGVFGLGMSLIGFLRRRKRA